MAANRIHSMELLISPSIHGSLTYSFFATPCRRKEFSTLRSCFLYLYSVFIKAWMAKRHTSIIIPPIPSVWSKRPPTYLYIWHFCLNSIVNKYLMGISDYPCYFGTSYTFLFLPVNQSRRSDERIEKKYILRSHIYRHLIGFDSFISRFGSFKRKNDDEPQKAIARNSYLLS